MSMNEYRIRSFSYQITHVTCRRTCGKETKAYPTIHKPTHYVNWGLPKTESQKAIRNAERGEISSVKSKRDDVENPSRQRSFRNSQRELTTLTWRREAVITY